MDFAFNVSDGASDPVSQMLRKYKLPGDVNAVVLTVLKKYDDADESSVVHGRTGSGLISVAGHWVSLDAFGFTMCWALTSDMRRWASMSMTSPKRKMLTTKQADTTISANGNMIAR
ncbi:hypothetical protein AaE_001616 [Aphanomyces astaci]|uniref:Uncharacterized protein n=1 Tax=Aphanomyces astaci TaxID=112090 RepID=A0A6A5AHN3_APHAT|nr:hypothetical protein AaE_001616 [Aphanomyces astaci]